MASEEPGSVFLEGEDCYNEASSSNTIQKLNIFVFTAQFFNILTQPHHHMRKQTPTAENAFRAGAKSTAFTLLNIFSVHTKVRAVIFRSVLWMSFYLIFLYNI